MALESREFFNTTTRVAFPRMEPKSNKVVTISHGTAEDLPVATPMCYNDSTDLWVVYTQSADAAIYTLTDQSADTDGGVFVVHMDGLSAPLAWNVTAAAAQTELLALLAEAGKGYTVAVTCSEANIGVAAAVMTFTFSETANALVFDVDTSGLLDGVVPEPGNLVLATTDAGTALNGADVIRGFIQSNAVTMNGTDEAQGLIMDSGDIHRDDVNTSTIRGICVGSPSEAELDTALRGTAHEGPSLRELDIRVTGLSQVR